MVHALGLSGRKRKADDPHEKTRQRVGASVRRALDDVRKKHPALYDQPKKAVKTGHVISYQPDALSSGSRTDSSPLPLVVTRSVSPAIRFVAPSSVEGPTSRESDQMFQIHPGLPFWGFGFGEQREQPAR